MLNSVVTPTAVYTPAAALVDVKNGSVESFELMSSFIGDNAWRMGLRRRDAIRSIRCTLLLMILMLLPLMLLVAFTSSRSVLHLQWTTRKHITMDTALEPQQFCKGVHVLLLIPTAPHQNERRQAIRDTWASSFRRSPLQVVFVIGRATSPEMWTSVTDEWRRFGDVLYRPDLNDTYGRLTQKTLSAFDWATRSCRQVPYIAKVDSDVFLRSDNLIRLLQHMPSIPAEFIVGQVNVRGVPKRDPKSRWFAPREIYPADTYPNYVFGAIYLMPSTTARRLVDSVRQDELDFASRLRLEDVFITGILARRLGVTRKHTPAFVQKVPNVAEVCSKPELISIHRISPQEMRKLWAIIHEC